MTPLTMAYEFSDVSEDFSALDGAFIRLGVTVPVAELARVEEGIGRLSKPDVVALIGPPNEAGSTYQDDHWLYNIDLALTDDDVLVCQYRVSFAQERLTGTQWRRPQCEALYDEQRPTGYSLSADLLFGFDSATISPAGQEAIREVATAVQQRGTPSAVSVIGHADRIGNPAYNMTLSQRRAEAVAAALGQFGVAPSLITPVGRGSSQPIASCDGVQGEALKTCLAPDRRVDISLSGSL
ncbi:OmpA family protein [Halomonas sp. 707D4]|uniref:OmpA family protein n=2 Tax=unclassified Halomonas TaxID=2609666 RepID=UPI00209F1B77|nr:OmpA family protein [Halomonas sp. 707D4]MCP1327988.1 OmpA family protein [Halomonas sp. 707D4]